MLISLLSLTAAIIILSLIFKFFPSIRSKRGYQEIESGWLSLGLENTSHGPNINSADPQVNNIKNASKEKQSQKQKKNKKSEKQKQTTLTPSSKQTNVFESASGEAIGKQIQNYDTLENGQFTSQHFILPFTSLPNEILAKLAKFISFSPNHNTNTEFHQSDEDTAIEKQDKNLIMNQITKIRKRLADTLTLDNFTIIRKSQVFNQVFSLNSQSQQYSENITKQSEINEINIQQSEDLHKFRIVQILNESDRVLSAVVAKEVIDQQIDDQQNMYLLKMLKLKEDIQNKEVNNNEQEKKDKSKIRSKSPHIDKKDPRDNIIQTLNTFLDEASTVYSIHPREQSINNNDIIVQHQYSQINSIIQTYISPQPMCIYSYYECGSLRDKLKYLLSERERKIEEIKNEKQDDYDGKKKRIFVSNEREYEHNIKPRKQHKHHKHRNEQQQQEQEQEEVESNNELSQTNSQTLSPSQYAHIQQHQHRSHSISDIRHNHHQYDTIQSQLILPWPAIHRLALQLAKLLKDLHSNAKTIEAIYQTSKPMSVNKPIQETSSTSNLIETSSSSSGDKEKKKIKKIKKDSKKTKKDKHDKKKKKKKINENETLKEDKKDSESETKTEEETISSEQNSNISNIDQNEQQSEEGKELKQSDLLLNEQVQTLQQQELQTKLEQEKQIDENINLKDQYPVISITPPNVEEQKEQKKENELKNKNQIMKDIDLGIQLEIDNDKVKEFREKENNNETQIKKNEEQEQEQVIEKETIKEKDKKKEKEKKKDKEKKKEKEKEKESLKEKEKEQNLQKDKDKDKDQKINKEKDKNKDKDKDIAKNTIQDKDIISFAHGRVKSTNIFLIRRKLNLKKEEQEEQDNERNQQGKQMNIFDEYDLCLGDFGLDILHKHPIQSQSLSLLNINRQNIQKTTDGQKPQNILSQNKTQSSSSVQSTGLDNTTQSLPNIMNSQNQNIINDNNKDNMIQLYLSQISSYDAPEVMKKGKYSEKSDVYSFGMICWELVTCRVPFDSLSPSDLITLVADGNSRPHFNLDDNDILLTNNNRSSNKTIIPVQQLSLYSSFIRNRYSSQLFQLPPTRYDSSTLLSHTGAQIISSSFVEGIPNGFISLVGQCWVTDPELRPTFAHICDILENFLFDI